MPDKKATNDIDELIKQRDKAWRQVDRLFRIAVWCWVVAGVVWGAVIAVKIYQLVKLLNA